MDKIKISLIVLISGILFQSCLKDRDAEEKAEENRIFEQYIKYNGIVPDSVSPSGLYYVEDLAGTGDKPGNADWIEFSFNTRVVSNPEEIVMTTDSLTARENEIYNELTLYGPKRVLMNSIMIAGLYEGLTMMKEGGKARFIFKSNLGYGRYTAEKIAPYSSLIFEVELLHVIHNIDRYERTQMANYLIMHNITDDSTSTGLVYHEVFPGTGDNPAFGDIVTLVYKGSFLNGKVFTDSDTEKTYSIGSSQLIEGFEEGVKLMKKGGKAKLIIPYYLAYGKEGYIYQVTQNYELNYYTLIWPYSTLVYDIELIDINLLVLSV
jgi:peptidylprolyl isomerase